MKKHFAHLFTACHICYFASVAWEAHATAYPLIAGGLAALTIIAMVFHLDVE